jgi:lipopolysaccharide/colanic/teichoic acid biosynthesis glycosyltransferase
MEANLYHSSLVKIALDSLVSFFGILLLSPAIITIAVLVKITSKGPIFFLQRRVGKDGKVFRIVKFRTMVSNASKIQNRYRYLNEADGVVFKIHNDPRFTWFGKYLARSGFDELPQLFNVLKGEMSMVGPRPLPVYEANKLDRLQKFRNLVKPGVTSTWVINGAHKLPFRKWMELDRKYVMNASLGGDVVILIKTFLTIMKHILNSLPRLIGF